MSRWWPEARRSFGLADAIRLLPAVVLLVAVIQAMHAVAIPTVSDLVFDLVPFLLCASVGIVIVFTSAMTERFESVLVKSWAVIAASASLAAALAFIPQVSVAPAGILSPWHAVMAILTFGVLPAGPGAAAMVRFLPALSTLCAAVVLFRRARPTRSIAILIAWYLVSSVLFNALSWIAFFSASAAKAQILTDADAVRAAISAAPDGFWSAFQQVRFFTSTGGAQLALSAVRAALLYLVTMMVLLVVSIRRVPSMRILVRRLTSRSVGAFFLVAIIGLTTGNLAHIPRTSYTDLLAQLVCLAAIGSFLVWWRMRRDLENLSHDLTARPSLPLPSGAVTPAEVDAIAWVAAVFAVTGASLLGWQALLPFSAAMAVAWMISRQVTGWGTGIIGSGVGAFAISGLLGLSALEVGLRQYPLTVATMLLIVSAALIAGIASAFCCLRDEVQDRITPSFIILLLTGGALVASRQTVLLYLLIPFVAVWIWITRKPSLWHKYGAYPLYALLIVFAFLQLFFPGILVVK